MAGVISTGLQLIRAGLGLAAMKATISAVTLLEVDPLIVESQGGYRLFFMLNPTQLGIPVKMNYLFLNNQCIVNYSMDKFYFNCAMMNPQSRSSN